MTLSRLERCAYGMVARDLIDDPREISGATAFTVSKKRPSGLVDNKTTAHYKCQASPLCTEYTRFPNRPNKNPSIAHVKAKRIDGRPLLMMRFVTKDDAPTRPPRIRASQGGQF